MYSSGRTGGSWLSSSSRRKINTVPGSGLVRFRVWFGSGSERVVEDESLVERCAEVERALGRSGLAGCRRAPPLLLILRRGAEEAGAAGEEGQGGGVHQGNSSAAHVRLQQRRGADPQDARGGGVHCLQRAGGPGAQTRYTLTLPSHQSIIIQFRLSVKVYTPLRQSGILN